MILTAVPNPAAATIKVTASDRGGEAVDGLVRSDRNGYRRPVRFLTGQNMAAGSVTVLDHEAALTGPVRYTCTAGAVTVATTTTLDGAGARLSVPVLPQYAAAPVVIDARTDAAPDIVVHDIIARPDPVLTMGPARYGRGTLTARVPSHDAAAALAHLYALGRVVLLRTGGELRDVYHAALSLTLAPAHPTAGGRAWDVSVSYVVTDPPPGPALVVAGWTFADVTALGSFHVVAAGYDTLGEVTTGPPP